MRIGSWETAIRGVPGAGYLIEAVNSVLASVMTGYHTQHTFDDKHGTIIATGPISERSRTVALGDPYNVPFTPSHFSGFSTMTWTVDATDVITWAYTLIGSTMTLWFDLRTTTIGGVPTVAVQIRIPDNWYAALTVTNDARLIDNGTSADGYVQSTAKSNILFVFRKDLAAFTASAGATSVQGTISFPVRTA